MLLADRTGLHASDWDSFSCTFRPWSTSIRLLHIFSAYFPFWVNPRRQLWERYIQFTFIVILYTLSTGWFVWLLNTKFIDLNLVSTIFLIFAIVLQGLSFIYMAYVFVLCIKQLFGNIDVEDMLIEMQHKQCRISWIKSFMNKPLETKISKRINRFLYCMTFILIIILFLWSYSFSTDIETKRILNEHMNITGYMFLKVIMWIILFIVVGVAFVIPFVVISSIFYLRIQDMRYLISNQQYYNKILDLYAIICSKHINVGSEINVINNPISRPISPRPQAVDIVDTDSDNDINEMHHYVDYNTMKRNDCRGLIKFYEQIYSHFLCFFNIFKYWFLLSSISAIIFIWCMISQVYGSCIHNWNKCACSGAISLSMLYAVYTSCIIIITYSAIQITHNSNELEKCIEYTLNKCIVDSYKIGIGNDNYNNNSPRRLSHDFKTEQQWNKEIVVLSRLSLLSLKKPLHFQIFGVKLTKPKAIWFAFIFITCKIIALLYEFLK